MFNNVINRVDSIKFLGVIITSNLSWFDHIQYISKKITTNLGLIYRLRSRFPSYILQTLYNSLVLPYLIYCISIWGFSPKSNLHTLNLSQNYYLRILFNLTKFHHISNYFKSFNILNIKQLHVLYSLLFTFKLLKLNYCPFLINHIAYLQSHRIRILRNNQNFYFFKPRLELIFLLILFLQWLFASGRCYPLT